MLKLFTHAFVHGKRIQNSVLIEPPLRDGTPFTLKGNTYYSEPDLFLASLMNVISYYPLDRPLEYLPAADLYTEFQQLYEQLLRSEVVRRNDVGSTLTKMSTPPLEEFIQAGPGALLIRRSGEGIYKVDVDQLSKYPVRDGFLRYGGCLTFDAEWKDVKLTYGGITVDRNDERWPTYEFYFRSSVLVWLVVSLHACYYHIRLSTYVQSQLSNERLKPFLHRNLASTEAARIVLLGEWRYFHRLYAFTYEGLDELVSDCLGMAPPPTFEELYNEMADCRSYPYFTDGKLVWDVLSRHYTSDETNFIFCATVNHEVVGNTIFKWQASPLASATKLTTNPCCDVESYRLTTLIAAATTLGRVTMLLDVIPNTVRDELIDVSNTIEQRNKRRSIVFNGANPRYLESTFSQ